MVVVLVDSVPQEYNMKKWFSDKKKQLRLIFSRLVLKGDSKFIPFLRKLKIYSLDNIKEQTREVDSVGVPYADGLIMKIEESRFTTTQWISSELQFEDIHWKDGKVTVLFCHPNRGFVIKTVETELLVAGLVDFGVPNAKSSSNPWRYILDKEPMWGGIQEIGTFSYNNSEPTRLNREDVDRMKEEIREEYKNKTEQ